MYTVFGGQAPKAAAGVSRVLFSIFGVVKLRCVAAGVDFETRVTCAESVQASGHFSYSVEEPGWRLDSRLETEAGSWMAVPF